MADILYCKEQGLVNRNCIVEGLLVASINEPRQLKDYSPEEWNCVLLTYMGE